MTFTAYCQKLATQYGVHYLTVAKRIHAGRIPAPPMHRENKRAFYVADDREDETIPPLKARIAELERLLRLPNALFGEPWLNCAITNQSGKQCSQPPEVWATVDGERVALCHFCYPNVRDGHYGTKIVVNVVPISPPNTQAQPRTGHP